MTAAFPEPDGSVHDPVTRVVAYLDFFRADVRRLSAGLSPEDLCRSVLPSGWTVPQLVEHLLHMERRWLVWGFLGEAVDDPVGDRDAAGRWSTDRGLEELLADLDAGGVRTSEIALAHDAVEPASRDGRFAGTDDPPTFLAVLFHVLQEYARHAGHLDIVRELIDGTTSDL